MSGVLRGVFAPRVFIVPLFISDGYFTEQVIPRELGFSQGGQPGFARVQQRGGQTLHYCGPVGTHASMTRVLLARARAVVEEHPAPASPKPVDTALFIAGHGTGNNENSRKVYPVFMEEEPRIGACWQMAQAQNLAMVPFFISDGLHSFEDIPVMLGEPAEVVQERLRSGQPTWRNPTERHGRRLWYAPSIGSEPLMAEVILERVREAADGRLGE